jgi:hypothetical protein
LVSSFSPWTTICCCHEQGSKLTEEAAAASQAKLTRKKSIANAFAQLGLEEDEEAPESTAAQDSTAHGLHMNGRHDDHDAEEAPAAMPKKVKKKKKGVHIAGAFASLDIEDDREADGTGSISVAESAEPVHAPDEEPRAENGHVEALTAPKGVRLYVCQHAPVQ